MIRDREIQVVSMESPRCIIQSYLSLGLKEQLTSRTKKLTFVLGYRYCDSLHSFDISGVLFVCFSSWSVPWI